MQQIHRKDVGPCQYAWPVWTGCISTYADCLWYYNQIWQANQVWFAALMFANISGANNAVIRKTFLSHLLIIYAESGGTLHVTGNKFL